MRNSIRTLTIVVIFGGLLWFNFTRNEDGVDWWTEWEDDWQWESHRSDQAVLPDDITTVSGIRINTSIAADLEALLAAARDDDVNLDGWGYRTNEKQIELRKRHCGETDFDVFEKPASQCNPPTAIPGRSRHERGLAIDFQHNGRTIRDRSNAGFVWLAENAATYGLTNLPSEPWHWSDNGR